VMWSAHFFVTHIQTEKISSWNGPTVHVCCFMLARASTKTFVSRVGKTAKKNLRLPKNSLAGSLVSGGITVLISGFAVVHKDRPRESDVSSWGGHYVLGSSEGNWLCFM